MKIQIADNKNNLVVVADLKNMSKALIGQTVCELQLIIKDLLEIYNEE